MKKLKLFLLTLIALTISNRISFAEMLKYNTEPNHTSVLWVANHFGFSEVSGKFTDVSGVINFDEAKPEKSSVEVTININSINTGIAKLDAHLKSADFFDAQKFATAKFVSKKITVTGKNTAKIAGDLTVRGITKNVVLDAVFNKSGINPINQKPSIGFSAKTTVNRSDFGIKYALPAIADKIDLNIQVEANR